MDRNDLYRSMNDIDDDILERSETHSRRRSSKWAGWAVAAAGIVLIAAGSLAIIKGGLFRSGNGSGSKRNDSMTYMFYAGPVFPMTADETDAKITAEREISLDFSPYTGIFEPVYDENGEETEELIEVYKSEIIVDDAYTLKNHSEQDQTVTLYYPFAASLRSSADTRPDISVDGESRETTLCIGPDPGSFSVSKEDSPADLSGLDTWEEYQALTETSYFSSALEPSMVPDRPVTVYRLDGQYAESSDAPAPTLSLEFTIDPEKTAILSYGFNGSAYEDATGFTRRDTFIPEPGSLNEGRSSYMIVFGEDIGPYELKAYKNGACEEPLENAGGTIVRYETTLGDILSVLVEEYLTLDDPVIYGTEDENLLSSITQEKFADLVSGLMSDLVLSDDPKHHLTDPGFLEDLFMETTSLQRVMYLQFSVTVPAGESIGIRAEMVKKASFDAAGRGKKSNGYDMLTTPGSALSFEGQTASVSGTEEIRILRQNFGFDLEKGITKVSLDLSEPHYYIEVERAGSR